MVRPGLAIFLFAGLGLANDSHTLSFSAPFSSDPTVKPLLGVIAGPDPAAANRPGAIQFNLAAQYKDVGILSVRNNDYFDDRLDMEQIFNCGGSTYPSWEGCDANDDRYYNWTLSDRQFQSWIDNGFDPFLRLGNETACGCRPRSFSGPQNAVQEDNWTIAARKVVQRYNNWQGRTNVLKYVDIWTEWPNGGFYDRPLADFPVFWVKAYKALKAAFPSLKIGGPGLLSGSTSQPTRDFLTYLHQNGVKPDWLGFHVFSSNPQDFLTEAQNYRQLLNGTGAFAGTPWAGTGFFSGVELICDAYHQGNTVEVANGKPREMTRTEADQYHNRQKGAAFHTASWIALQYADVERSYYYRGDDGNSTPGADPNVANSAVGGPGLFYGDGKGTAKPKANAFRFYSRLYRDFPALLANPAQPSSVGSTRVWALGAQSQDGSAKAVLVANPNDAPVDLTVRFNGVTVSPGQFARIEIYTVDDVNDGKAAVVGTSGSFTVPANTTQLLIFSSILTPARITILSAASFSGSSVAADSIVSAFGSGLPSSSGASVSVKDSSGATRSATIHFASWSQVNFVAPAATRTGLATVEIANGATAAGSGSISITSVAPGLFTASGNGQGVPAANVLRVKANGSQSSEPIAQYDAAQKKWNALPIDLGPATDQVYLVLYGTGIRNRLSLSAVSVTIGGLPATVGYAGAQGEYAGLDQINVLLPRTLAGRGAVDLLLTADGQAANTVQVNVK